ncbi:MAG: hypothetical protein JO128_21630 [Alphaproteobacteria bacterium]|nr:hypothetical protein [Alphaproteobacteria bacterium]
MKKFALLTAAAAVLMAGAAFAQNAVNPTAEGPSKSHAGNPDPTSAGARTNPNAPATDKRNNPGQAGPASSPGSSTSTDPTNMNPRNTTEKK